MQKKICLLSSGLAEWKKLAKTKWPFERLDGPLENSKTYMKIIWKKYFLKVSSNDSTAFIMALVELFLDPNSGTVEMNEKVVTPKMLICPVGWLYITIYISTCLCYLYRSLIQNHLNKEQESN